MKNELIKTKSPRNASFELVRIIAMFFIVLHHFQGHGGWQNFAADGANDFFLTLLRSLFLPSVNVFVMISAYFMCTKKDLRLPIRKLAKLWLTVFFYSMVLFAIFASTNEVQLTPHYILQTVFPTLLNKYWFFSSYFIMMLAAPLLNIIINKLSKMQHLVLCIVIIVGASLTNISAVLTAFPLSMGYNAIWFILLYFIVAFIRKYDISLNNVMLVVGGVVFIACVVIGYFIGGKYISLHTILMSLYIFLVAKRFAIKNAIVSKVICFISPLTFGVYLISDSPEMRGWMYENLFHSSSFAGNKFAVLILIGFALATFVACALIEYMRQLAFKGIDVVIHKIMGDKLSLAQAKLDAFISRITNKVNGTNDLSLNDEMTPTTLTQEPQSMSEEPCDTHNEVMTQDSTIANEAIVDDSVIASEVACDNISQDNE